MKRALLVAILALIALPAAAAKPTGDQILAAMKRQFGLVNDYQTDVSLSIHGSKISINDMRMHLYYKKPNKMHVDATQGMAIVPGGNLFGDPLRHLSEDAHPTYVKTEKKNQRDCYVLKLSSGPQNTMLWVDKERSVIVAMEGQGGFKCAWSYDKIDGKYYLPVGISGELPDPSGRNPADPVKADVTFSNYRVNKGISDKIFEEKQPKQSGFGGRRHWRRH